MYIPVVKKITEHNDVYIERALPAPGAISTTKGTAVEPFDKLGICKISVSCTTFPPDFIPLATVKGAAHFKEGDVIGNIAKKRIKAPFDGFLKDNVFFETARDFQLLAGVWGTVDKVLEGTSVLLKTQTKDVLMVAATHQTCEGELVVFPNPSDMLLGHYFDEFAKSAYGKIIYVGNHVTVDLLEEAKRREAKAILAGSATRQEFYLAKRLDMCLGIFEGFGKVNTSDLVFNELKSVANRFVFFCGETNCLKIPYEKPFPVKRSSKSLFKLVKSGLKVQVLQDPYFGEVGTVDRVGESSILVKFEKSKGKSVEVLVPNILALE